MYTEIYNSERVRLFTTDEFDVWLRRLRDREARARINLRLRRIGLTGNLGDTKSVGSGVREMRINYGPGYRVYFTQRGRDVILLLIGGDKSSQDADIRQAIKINAEYA